jgi:iron complex outermembrane receptor protein
MRATTKLFLLKAFIVCSALHANAQVSGRVFTSDNKPFPFCNVALIRVHDSSMVSAAVTDTAGTYVLQATASDTVVVMAFYPGYGKKYSASFFISDKNAGYKAGDIKLEGTGLFLKGVQVSAEKPFVEYQPDKTVYNIENSIISAGNNVLEVLKKLPGVVIDNNDNIKAGGQSGVLVMIDGRPTYLSGTDLVGYLKSLNASQVEKIEVIANPSAKYDAGGSSVINIVLKKNKKPGLNAELTSSYSQGIYYSDFEGINLNYSSTKWNIFANYGYSFDKTVQYIGSDTKFMSNDVVLNTFDDSLKKKSEDIRNNGMVTINFIPDKRQTIGIVAEGTEAGEIFDKNYLNRMYGSSPRLDSTINLLGHRTMQSVNMTFDLNYDLKIDTTGRDLSASVDYATYSQTFNELDASNYYDTLNQVMHAPTILQFSLPNTVKVWAAKIDYTQPVGKNGRLDMGLKSSFVTTENNAQYWNVVNGVNYVDSAFTNNFTYSEYIYAGYLSYTLKLGSKTNIELGLRGEETQAKGIQSIHDTTFTHNYFKLFPNIRITEKLDTNNTIFIRYRRRIWRPDYQSLNPFIHVINPYTYDLGNPDLQPAISNSASVGEIYKQIISIEAGDEYWLNTISNVVSQNNNTHIIYTTPINFKSFNNIFGRVDATIPVKKWFMSMNSFFLMQQEFQTVIQDIDLTNSQLVWAFNSVNTFNLGKEWSCEVDFNYSSKGLDGEFKVQPIYTLYAGIKKSFADKKGTASLSLADILWSERYNEAEVFQNTNNSIMSYSDSRRIQLSISWKLGKDGKERQEHDKADEEEINRIKR